MPTPRRHYAELDSLRAFAVLGVMWFHLAPETWQLGIRWENGVYLFFVLSGYLISSILMRQLDERPSEKLTIWRQFVGRRSRRILPAYYAALLLGLAMLSPPVLKHFWLYLLHGANFVTIFTRSWPPGVSHFWTLGVELQYYLAWSIAVAFTPPRFRLHLIIATGVAAILWREMTHEDPLSHLYPWALLDFFSLGALLAWLQLNNHLPSRTWGLVATLAGAFSYTSQLLGPLTMPSLALSCAGLIILGIQGTPGSLGRTLRHPAILYTGTISYGLYLFHNFTPYLSSGIAKALGTQRADLPLLALLIEFPSSFLLAHLSYTHIEQRWLRKRQKTPAP